jgi:hypothetical protein
VVFVVFFVMVAMMAVISFMIMTDDVVMIGMNVAANHQQKTSGIVSDGVEEGSIEAHLLLMSFISFVMVCVMVVIFSFLQSDTIFL